MARVSHQNLRKECQHKGVPSVLPEESTSCRCTSGTSTLEIACLPILPGPSCFQVSEELVNVISVTVVGSEGRRLAALGDRESILCSSMQ